MEVLEIRKESVIVRISDEFHELPIIKNDAPQIHWITDGERLDVSGDITLYTNQ